MIDFIISLFTQKKCFSCQKLGHFFCPKCNESIIEYHPYCYVCKKLSDNFSVHGMCQKHFPIKQVIVLTRYRNSGVKKLLRHAKYYNKYPAYKDLIFQHKEFFNKNIDSTQSILVPVPMYFLRKWKRGYNQSDIIAQNVSQICQIPANKNFIKRIKYTKQQSHLSQSDRIHNLDDAFKLGKQLVDKNTTIYLVDDVISTGSTLGEIAKYLQKNGYKDIRAIVLASD